MNVFEYLNEMESAIKSRKNVTDKETFISMEEHNQEMLNMIQILKTEMEMAEYNYTVENLSHTVHTFGEYTVLQQELNDELILVQPLALGESELSMIDMQSLCDILQQVKDNNLIKQNIVIVPPNITFFKAKLAQPKDEN